MTRFSQSASRVQRRVIHGDVIVVRSAAPPQGPDIRQAEEVRRDQAVPEPSQAAAALPEPQPYTPAPPGYAYEFGTWRLVPVD